MAADFASRLSGVPGVRDRVISVKNLADLGEAVVLQTIKVEETVAGSPVIFTPAAGKIFLVYSMLLQVGGGVTTVRVKSGTTEIALLKISNTDVRPLLEGRGIPWFVGRVAGEALVFTIDAAVTGFVNVGTRDV